jgi:N-acyl-D-amino-acid deacylase
MSAGVVLGGGTVVDGTGAAPVLADVVVVDGRIDALVAPGTSVALPRVDCTGLTVTPGFVDIHTHSDLTRLRYPDAETRTLQGITTEVIGNCGMSPVPVSRDLAGLREVLGPIDVAPDVEFTWSDTAGYLDALVATPGATNLVPLLGHGSLRHSVMGSSTLPAGADERAEMASALEEALDLGFWGMSFGFMYAPGELSDLAEQRALATVLHRHDGALLTSHLRAYDHTGLVGGVREMLSLAEYAQVPLEISHLRSINDDGSAIDQALTLLYEATVDVEADAYPYLAGHTTLLQLLPEELRSRGVPEIARATAEEPGAVAAALRRNQHFDPDQIMVVKGGEGSAPEVGSTLADLATDDWAAAAEGLIARYAGNVDVIVVGTRPEDALRVLADPIVSVASDGVGLALDHAANRPHPRSIGTFPRAFQELRDDGMDVARIVHKMTGKPAARMGIRDRGFIAPGFVADLVVLDPAAMRDNASYQEPLVPPSGIHHVLVSGEFVLDDGQPTHARPGTLLRRNP